ncbi:PEP-utilizing enzyme [Actinospongicola halichondriae]|uniref:PEP-utilizing enzyme n=1 Tax=Actinospongicola halichondriae TaxID=3236844 RepID=UPI003D5B880D
MPTTTTAFDSPDGRVWERDADHVSVPRTPMMRPLFDDEFGPGLATTFERLGAPLARAESCHVRGWGYLRMVPAGAPDRPGGSAKPPPDLVMKVLTRVHPELRRREKNARRAIETEVWMDDVAAWGDERPRWVQTFDAHQSLDLRSLDDGRLADELERMEIDARAMFRRHFELVTPAAGVGLAVLAAQEHGIEGAEVAEALRGCSAATAAPTVALRAIAAAVDRSGAGSPADLDALRAASDEVRGLVDQYLAIYGWRSLGDDLNAPTLAETPDVLARSVRAAGEVGRAEGPTDPILDLVARIPADDRARVERLLRQAGAGYEMMDDNSAMACRAIGLLRRVVLDAGRRMVEVGRLDDVDDVFLLTTQEVGAVLRGAAEPTIAEIRDRNTEFLAAHDLDAPHVLGGEPGAPPDPSVFPKGLGAITAAVSTYLGLRFPPPTERAETGRVEVGGTVVATGHGIGGGAGTGRAVVAMSADDAIERLEPGDVLVCPVTNPAYNVVFPIAAAVVTAVGGPFGHTAVTAREVGIPAVVGIGDLGVVTDGDEITVIGG